MRTRPLDLKYVRNKVNEPQKTTSYRTTILSEISHNAISNLTY